MIQKKPLTAFSSYVSGTRRQGCGLGLDVSVSRRSRDLSKVSSRSRLGHVGERLGLVSVSGAKVSVLVSVSTV